MIVANPAGTTVLTLGDSASVGGYLVTAYDEGSRSWRRVTTSSPRVDGEFDVASALGRTTLTLEVFISGTSWADIRTKHRALLAAVEVTGWILNVDGSVLWRCEKADSASPTPGLGMNSDGRLVTLTIPAQPVYGI
jgi:hypothetical protein